MTPEKKAAISPYTSKVRKIVKKWGFEDEERQISVVKNWLSNFEVGEIPLMFNLLQHIQLLNEINRDESLER